MTRMNASRGRASTSAGLPGSASHPWVHCLAPMRNPRHTLPVAGDLKRAGGNPAPAVRAYYESNTRLFLSLGMGEGHWPCVVRCGVGVAGLSQAVHYVNTLIAAEALACNAQNTRQISPRPRHRLRCGGSLLFLCRAAESAVIGVGVTISPLLGW